MQILYSKIMKADGIVFGTPIHFYGMTAQAKTIIDRTYSLNKPDRSLRNKVGGVVTVAGSLGLINALKDFYFFFSDPMVDGGGSMESARPVKINMKPGLRRE